MRLAVAVAALVCGGCTTLEGATQAPGYKSTLDADVMKFVEVQARTNGAQVYWINPPRKAKTP